MGRVPVVFVASLTADCVAPDLFLPPAAAAIAAIVPPTTTATPTPMPTFARVDRPQFSVPGYGTVKSAACCSVTATSAHKDASSSVPSTRRAVDGLLFVLNQP